MYRMMRWMIGVAALTVAVPSFAQDFRCKGERIEKGSSTWGYAKSTGSDYRIEKGSSTIAFVKKRNSYFAVEVASSTIGWLKGDRIEKFSGLSWGRLSEAERFAGRARLMPLLPDRGA